MALMLHTYQKANSILFVALKYYKVESDTERKNDFGLIIWQNCW
jgi:hypothetical protein